MATFKIAFGRGEARLVSLISEPLGELGFVRLRDLLFGRRLTTGCLQRVAFGARHGKTGEFCFSFGVGVRFEDVQALLSQSEDPFAVTVSSPLSVLNREHSGFPEWCFDGKAEPAEIVRETVTSFTHFGLPFLQENSNLEIVERALQSEDPRKWFTCTPEQRIATLAAIQYVTGRSEIAIGLVTAALEERREEMPSKRKLLHQLLARMELKAS